MKKSVTILLLSVFLYFLPGWNRTLAQTPLNFQGSEYSPVLALGGSGTWEGYAIVMPYAFLHEGTYYLYYSGFNNTTDIIITSIGMASSSDGYSFTKYAGNPVLAPSGSGFDSFNVTAGIVIEDQTGFVMYYNGREIPGFGPGPSIGRATADDPSGPWSRGTAPVLTVGSPDEWDAGFITPNAVLPLDTGGFVMFYSGGADFFSFQNFQIGMATSPDGIVWTKYDDPLTISAPYSESDPVLENGNPGDWDGAIAWLCNVVKKPDGYGYDMYYTGSPGSQVYEFGYAYSPDGISWTKYAANPVYTINDDPYAVAMGYGLIEQPAIVFNGSVAFMYYDYGQPYPGEIGVATADVPPGINDENITDYGLRITNYPNPVSQSTTFSYKLKKSGNVTIQIFNSFGQIIAEPLNAYRTKGEQNLTWNAENLPFGIYFYRIQAGKEVGGGKFIKW